ncbi:MAG: hypothetical protein IT518_02655 [Burkholderiales bacterium]|nr:hypothetical protein [Burkholderiales bacterium]
MTGGTAVGHLSKRAQADVQQRDMFIDALQAAVDGLAQGWDKNLPAGERFTVLAAFDN